jgi:transmembrane sensor
MEEELNKRALIIKFLTNDISDNEINVLKVWLEKDPANRLIFDKENELWQESGIKTKSYDFDTENAWLDISAQLGIEKNRIKHVVILNKNKFRIFMAAASVAFLIAIAGFTIWFTKGRSDNQILVATTSVFTNEGDKSHILLPDSTVVYMNSESSIEYSNGYNINERNVKLKGEAYFDVHTNPEKPFVVHLNNISVSAKGTKFNVLSYAGEDRTEITLEEGLIQIAVRGQETIEVKPGQQFVLYSKTNKTLVRDVSTEAYTSWKENKLRFIDTPFEEVLRKLGRRYNVVFEVRNRDLFELKYTATFIDESIEDVMMMLKAVSPITYKINYRTTLNDKQYLKPKIVLGKRKVPM